MGGHLLGSDPRCGPSRDSAATGKKGPVFWVAAGCLEGDGRRPNCDVCAKRRLVLGRLLAISRGGFLAVASGGRGIAVASVLGLLVIRILLLLLLSTAADLENLEDAAEANDDVHSSNHVSAVSTVVVTV